ncbi:MAG TPA: gamma-glutamyltransferase [Gemmataceae bacterium]|jgi:gamma-glutamyltranspeptidase/glutathione hydrolase
MHSPAIDRRTALKLAAGAALAGPFARLTAAEPTAGLVEGHPEGAKAGMDVLAAGGNAVDAVVAAALVTCVVSPFHVGVGGYGGHLTVATGDGRTVSSIDFNTAAPAAARPDMFPVGADGKVVDRANFYGWKAVGVPGVPAGLQRALDRFGTRSFADVAAPAIRYARDGFPAYAQLVNTIRTTQKRLAADPGSAKLYLPGGQPPKVGDTFKNPDLAALLETLAKRGTVESFYRGEVAAKIAAAFRAHGGLVTEADLAAYQARDVEPVSLSWRGLTVRTPPPTAGGATAVEALAVLKELKWDEWSDADPRSLRGRLEALRLCWDDRLRYFGDPLKGPVPLDRILSQQHAAELAAKVEQSLRDNKPAPARTDNRFADGTRHLSAVDARGMMVAITLTHGGSFGAQVTVDGLGLTLGHGMSRFNPEPGHPNSVGPGKRPLHNMCPTVVLKDGRPTLALGGRGGRKIPNAVFEVLARHIGRGMAPKDAIAAPRIHTEGGLAVALEKEWPESAADQLRAVGYTVTRAASATVSAVWRDPATGAVSGASR